MFAGQNKDIPGMMLRLRGVADELGLPLGERKKTFNSRLAQELAKWAESKGKGDPFHDGVFRAYFVEGRNIGKLDELVLLAKSVGLPEKEAREVMVGRAFKGAVDADWLRSRELGITAVPTFLVNGQVLVGFRPFEALEHFLKQGGAKKRMD